MIEIKFEIENDLCNQLTKYCKMKDTNIPKVLTQYIRNLNDNSLQEFLEKFTLVVEDKVVDNIEKKGIETSNFLKIYNIFRVSNKEHPITITKLNRWLKNFPYIYVRQNYKDGKRYYLPLQWIIKQVN